MSGLARFDIKEFNKDLEKIKERLKEALESENKEALLSACDDINGLKDKVK